MSSAATPGADVPDAGNGAGPLVSVIVPVYNSERYLERTLESMLAQTYRHFEAIVVDDGSTDGSAAIMRRFAERDGRVHCVSQRNAGMVGARNNGMRMARGRYYALLDSDDLWMPDHLERAVAALEADPSLVLVHAGVRFVDEQGDAFASFIDNRAWDAWVSDPFAAILLRYEHVACQTTVFRRDVIDRAGGFDDRFNKLGCEDRDLWLRLARLGGVRYLPYHGADYRVHAGGMSRNAERMLKARLILAEKMRQYPEGRRLYRRARAAIELSRAESSAPLPAAWACVKAIGWSPADVRAWKGLARWPLSVFRGRATARH